MTAQVRASAWYHCGTAVWKGSNSVSIKEIIGRLVRKVGFAIRRYKQDGSDLTSDLTEEEKRIVSLVESYTMTGVDRIVTLMNAVRYIARSNIPGDIVECGVWRGGSMMAVAAVLLSERDTSRHLYLYDTFEGMPDPTERDVRFDGRMASALLADANARWGIPTLDEVRANMVSIGYPETNIHFIVGKVEDTLPGTAPEQLSILRLDTDWYQSTKHELIHLFPRLRPFGILIIDDYGHWTGARQATDEYFAEYGIGMYLHRIDYSARIGVKHDGLDKRLVSGQLELER